MITSNGDIIPPLIFLRSFRLNVEAYIKCLEEIVLLLVERVAFGRLVSGNKTLHDDTQAEEPTRECQAIYETTATLTSCYLIPYTAIFLIITRGEQLSEQPANEPPCNTKGKVIAVFSNRNQETVQKSFMRFQNHVEPIVEAKSGSKE